MNTSFSGGECCISGNKSITIKQKLGLDSNHDLDWLFILKDQKMYRHFNEIRRVKR